MNDAVRLEVAMPAGADVPAVEASRRRDEWGVAERRYHDQMHRLYRAVRELVPRLPDGSVDVERIAAEFARQVQRLGLVVPGADPARGGNGSGES